MKYLLNFIFAFVSFNAYSQNISIDFAKREIIGMGSIGDTTVYLTQSMKSDSLVYPLFYKKDSLVWPGRTFFHVSDFDSLTKRIYIRGNPVPEAGYNLKSKVSVKLKKTYKIRVGMMPTFGWYTGKKKPGRYKLIGYQLRVESEAALCYEGMVFYYFQKQSFFKRFFKKRKLRRRIKKLPVLLGADGPEVIFKNDMIQEGGQVKENYYIFKLKLQK